MAEGDLIVGPTYPQYEYNGLLWGSNTILIVESVKGLFDPPDVRTTDSERQDAWGDFPGKRLYKARFPEFNMHVAGTITQIEQYVISIPSTFLAEETPRKLVYQRTGDVKKFLWAKVEKANFPSDYDLAHGHMNLDVMFKCDDPRRYSLIEFTDVIALGVGVATNTVNVTNNGSVDGRPTFDINGPCTNPRIQNAQDSARSIKIDVVLGAADTLLVDVKSRTVSLNGIDYSQYVRQDNQWWSLKPGVNQITYSRDAGNVGAASSLDVRHRDVWN